MSDVSFIIFARAIHVLAGVFWAGSSFVIATTVTPLAAKHSAEGAGRWLGMVARRAARLSMIGAALTVLSGGYLLYALHAHDTSISGLVLDAGTVAALIALAVGFLVGRPAALALAKIRDSGVQGDPLPAEKLRAMVSLRLRAAVATRVATGLFVCAIIAMSVFRYAAALG